MPISPALCRKSSPWCEQEGHDVTFVCYNACENLVEAVPDNVDILFIGAFTEAAHLAYALSHLYRSHGAVTVLGGPHARCYPQDAAASTTCWASPTGSLFATFARTAPRIGPSACTSQRDSKSTALLGSASAGSSSRRRCRSALHQIVPMLDSLGVPTPASFCIDAAVPHQPLGVEVMQEDLRFLMRTLKRPRRLARSQFRGPLQRHHGRN